MYTYISSLKTVILQQYFQKRAISNKSSASEDRRFTASPTAPSPKTATVDPFLGFATFKVAPRPTELNSQQ